MYGYEEYINITPEQLLQKVTREEILEFVLGEPFDIGKKYISPFREDKHPNCRFERRYDGAIIFIDFGEKFRTGRTHRSVFGMVMEKFNVTLPKALAIICNRFGLSVSSQDYQPVSVFSSIETATTTNCTIRYEAKTPDKSDKIFWSQFLITMSHLTEDNTFCARTFSITKGGRTRVITPYKCCYVFDFIDQHKVYQPYNEQMKFISSCNEDVIGNFDNLPATGEEVIVQKSYKDHRVLRNVIDGLNVIWFQNEGCVPSMGILKNLTDRFKLITIFFDNDYHGVMAALKLVEMFNSIRPNCARMVHMPVFIGKENRKDPGAFVSKEGRKETIQVLNHIGIYGKDTSNYSSIMA